MNGLNIQHHNGQAQDTGRINMQMRQMRNMHPAPHLYNLYALIDGLVRDYGERMEDGYSFFISELSIAEKRLVLSHILDSEEYDEAMASHSMTEAYFTEHRQFIQSAVDYQSAETYRDFLESATYYCE